MTDKTTDEAAAATAKTKQLTRDDLKSMSPDEIVAARKSGALNDLLRGER